MLRDEFAPIRSNRPRDTQSCDRRADRLQSPMRTHDRIAREYRREPAIHDRYASSTCGNAPDRGLKLLGIAREAQPQERARRRRRRRCPARGRHSPRRSAAARAGACRSRRRPRRTDRTRPAGSAKRHAAGRRRARRRRSRGRAARARSDARRSSRRARAPRRPARCMNCATPEVEYWIRFSITWPSAGMRHDPADAPAGHRPVLGERVDEEDAVLRLHHVEEGRRARDPRRTRSAHRSRRR